MSRASDVILAENAALLEDMLTHPFVTALADGSLPDAAYHRYLVYEGAFVDTAISIFAFATARAPNLAAKRWLVDVQLALTGEQMAYFEESFAALGVDTDIPMPPAVTAFDRGMYEIAERGSFLQIVTAMFAAEWMYWTWCSAAAEREIADPHRKRWIDLHAAPEFAAQAHWLRDAIDRHATPQDVPQLSGLFGRVTALEIAFHHAPLAPTGALDA